MKKNIQLVLFAFVMLTILMSACAPAPTPVPSTATPSPSPSPIPPTFTPEPTATATQAPGNLESQDIGCVPISDLKNTFDPLELYLGMRECVNQDNYSSAVFFFGLAGTYSYYDTLRVADTTAHVIKTVLLPQILGSLNDAQKEAFSQEIEKAFENPDNLSALCDEMIKIGAPQYYPDYMIQHGMNAFGGSNPEEALVKDFNSDAAWSKALDAYVHCPNLPPPSDTATPGSATVTITFEPPTPTLSNTNGELAVEQIAGLYKSYAGSEKNLGGTAFLNVLTDDSGGTVFLLDSDLPSDKEGFAGFFIAFDHEENLSKYKTIEFTIQFQAKDKKILLYFQDREKKQDSVLINSTGTDEMDVSIELEQFNDVDLNAVFVILFIVDTTFDRGSQSITVSKVRFIP